jgi:Domain of unknown function (DU1801)
MALSKAKTVKEYLDELPAERRREVSKVRSVVRKNLPRGYREGMSLGMITYEIPLERFPNTYNKQPLCYAGLAAQKSFNTIYLMGAYGDPKQRQQLEEAFRKSGKKMDMGKSCLHFRAADDLPLDAIGEIIASTLPDKMIEAYEASRPAKSRGSKSSLSRKEPGVRPAKARKSRVK